MPIILAVLGIFGVVQPKWAKMGLPPCLSGTELLNWNGNFVVTKSECVVQRLDGSISERKISLRCYEKTVLEEADSRMVIHVKDNILLHNNIKIAIR